MCLILFLRFNLKSLCLISSSVCVSAAFVLSCVFPQRPHYGDVSVSSLHSGGEAFFSCLTGYQLQGSSVLTCRNASTPYWRGKEPHCRGEAIRTRRKDNHSAYCISSVSYQTLFHGGIVIGTIASQQESDGSLCSTGSLSFSSSSKTCNSIDDSVSMNVCLSICVSPVIVPSLTEDQWMNAIII